MHKQQPMGILLILSAAILWGTTGTAQSFAPLTLSSYWVGSARLLVAGVFFILWLWFKERAVLSGLRLRDLPWKAIVLGALGMAIYNLAFFAGIRATSVAVGTAIALGSSPVWAGLLQAVINRQSPSSNWWAVVSVAVAGLTASALGATNKIELSLEGVGLCLLSGFAYAVYAMSTKHVVARTSAGVATTTVFVLSALLALPFAYFLAGVPQVSVVDIPVMLWLGIIATGVAYLLFSMGLKFVSSATAVALALAEPVAAFCLAVLIVGEQPSLVSMLGLLTMLLGLALLIKLEVMADELAEARRITRRV